MLAMRHGPCPDKIATDHSRFANSVDCVPVHRLAKFVRADDRPQVQAMLALHPVLAKMEASYGDEHHPLHSAVTNQLPKMTRLWMQHGADARADINPHRDATAPTIVADRGFGEIISSIQEEA